MQLSDFSLLKEDEDSYTIGHPKGKSMKIPKQGMSEKAQHLVSKLRREQKFYEGTPEGTEKTSDATENDNDETVTMESPAASEPSLSDTKPGISAQAESAGVPLNLDPTTPPPGMDKIPSPETPQTPLPAPPAPEASPQSNPIQSLASTFNSKPIETAQKDIQSGVKAQAAAGQTEAEALKEATDKIGEIQNEFDTRKNTMDAQSNNLLMKINNNKIDPDRYWNNLGTGSKIAASFGMLLSGIGSGLTHTPNMAVDAINKHINEDIEAQKNDQSKNMSLWKMNREALGSDQAATLATQSQLLTLAKAKATQAQAAAIGPEAKARMAPVILGLSQQGDQINRQRTALDMANSPAQGSSSQMKDPASLVQILVPKEHQAKVFGEIEAAQDTRRMSDSIMKSFEDAANENTIAKTGFGFLRTPASVGALHQAMQPTFKDLEGTVRQAAMDNTFKNITPSPGDSDYTISQKRKALQGYLKSKESAPTAKGYGIDLTHFKSTNLNKGSGYLPGQAVSVKGKHYKVGEDGDTLTPI